MSDSYPSFDPHVQSQLAANTIKPLANTNVACNVERRQISKVRIPAFVGRCQV